MCIWNFVGDKAVLNAASENINISVTNTEGEARAVYAGLSLIKTSML